MKFFYKIYSLIATALLLAFSSFAQNPNGNWTITGPISFPTNISGQIHGIGRVCQMKFHNSNSQKIYAVSASGGLWISNDAGASWNKTGTDNELPQITCSSVCIDNTNDNIIYLSTGDPDYYSDGYGIYKSTDGGVTWFPSNAGIGFRMAVEILMHPLNNNVLIAATSDGIWKSTDAGANWIATKAGGAFTDMVFKPGSSSIMYAADTASFWRSTNAGDTWTQITSVNPTPGNGGKLAVSTANDKYVYVAFVGSNKASGGSASGGVVYRSTNSGQSFTLRKGDVYPNLNGYEGESAGQGLYNWAMFADRTNANTVYAVGHVVWKSTNGGTTWTKLTNWYEKCHTDMHQLISSPYDNSKLFDANDGGIFLSTDGGSNWTPTSDGLSATEVYHMGQSNLSADIADIGTQDNGELYFDTNTWYTNRGGDFTPNMKFDYNKANTVYYVNSGERRDLDITNSGTVSYGLTGTTDDDKYAMTLKNKNLAYVSQGTMLKRTKNLTNTTPVWKKLKTFVSDIKAVAVSPLDNNEVYVVLGDNKIFYSSNAFSSNAPTFKLVSMAPSPTNLAANIAVNKNDTSIVYMTCGSKVYRSPDKAVSWTDITGNLPNVNIIDLVHDRNSKNEGFYIASAIGVYYRNTTMSEWQSFAKGLPTVARITNLSGYFNTAGGSLLRVSFYGRGVWQSPLFNKTGGCTNVNVSITFDGYPQETSWKIRDATNAVVAFGGPYNASTPGSTLNQTVCLPDGCYTFTMYDAYGDGICCAYGNGSYALTTGANTIAAGGSFGLSESTGFCIPYPAPLHNNPFADNISKNNLNESAGNSAVKIIPNPARQNANIVISSKQNILAFMQVADANGKVILYRKQEIVKGTNQVSLDLNNFSSGLYYVLVKMGKTTITKKLEVIK